MLVVVFINEGGFICIVGRIQIYTFHFTGKTPLKHSDCLVVIAVNQQTIRLLVQIRYTFQQLEFERVGEMLGIDDQILILTQEIDGRRVRPAFRFVDGVHGDPFINLRFVPDNLRPEGFVDLVQRDAPVGLHHEFLLQPQLLLEILNLRKEIDDDFTDALDGLHLGKVGFHTDFAVGVQILQMHNFTLNEEIQLACKKTTQIFMDEIIEGVLCNIALQMLLYQGSGLLALACGDRRDQGIQLCPVLGQQPCRDSGIVFLGVFLFLIFWDIVHEADNDFCRLRIVFKTLDARVVFFILRKEHESALAVLALFVVVLLRGSVHQAEMDSDPVENEGVIFEILAGFDVVLILICPVELYFLALVGDSVHAFLIPTFGNKIAILIVSVEEGIQRRVHVRLQCGQISTFRKLLLELQILLLLLSSIGERIHSHAHF